MHIYTLTMIEDLDEDYGTKGYANCFGYSTDFDYLDYSIKNNVTDLHETIYRYGVIEKVEEGLNPVAWERWFYQHNKNNGKYEHIEEPECVKHLVNFAMG